MSDTISISLLGGVEISGLGRASLSARAVALLGYLISHAGSPQPRAHLADELWPDSDPAQARTNLRRELHHLRAALAGVPSLRVDSGALTWVDGPDCEVDVRKFLAARADAMAALTAGDSTAFVEHSVRALGHVRGAFLPGCYDDWAVLARDELRLACVELCDRGVADAEERGDPAAGIRLARTRVTLEPLEEPGYRQLIRLQRLTGDRAGAMRTYHRCASVLEQELGVEPSPETRRERDRVLAAATADDTAAAERTGDVSRPAPELVGRDRERALLRGAWRGVRDGCRFVLISGEPGAGKTRLVADLASEVRRDDGVAASARCFAATGGLPMAPAAEWLRSPQLRAAGSSLAPVWRAEVDRLVPDAAPGDGLTTATKVEPWQRLRFFEGLARAVVAVDRPLLLVLEDLQWCDKATLSWLSFLMSFAQNAPLLVVATAREEELSLSSLAEPLRAMTAGGQLSTLELGPLSTDETALLGARVLGHPLTTDDVGLLRSVTGGNPFYVIEALREARAGDGSLHAADLRGVLERRLSRLTEPARQVAGLISAVGRDASLELLIEASDLDAATVVRSVDELWRRRVIDQRGQGYDFAHDLLRDAAYDALAPAQRWLLHRRLAQAMELMYAGRTGGVAAPLAEHYDRSGQPGRALPFYEAAARQAGLLFAHADAVRLWKRCLDLLRDLPAGRSRDERELAVIRELLPPLNAARGYAAPELEAFERRADELGELLGRTEVRAAAAIALFSTTFVQGRTAQSHRWGAQGLRLVEHHPDLAANAHMCVAGGALGLGRLQAANRHFGLACELAGDADSLPIGTRTAVHARAWWAHARWLLGDDTGASAAAEQAVRTARSLEHAYSLAVALSYLALTLQLRGEREALREALRELGQLCDTYAFAYYREWALVFAGWLRGGDTGAQVAEQGIANLRRQGALARMPYWLSLTADLHRREGDQATAAALLDAAESFAIAHDDLWWLPEILRARAALVPAVAEPLLRRAVDLAAAQSSATLLDRCRSDLAALTAPRAFFPTER